MPLLDALPYLFPIRDCQSLNSNVARKGRHCSDRNCGRQGSRANGRKGRALDIFGIVAIQNVCQRGKKQKRRLIQWRREGCPLARAYLPVVFFFDSFVRSKYCYSWLFADLRTMRLNIDKAMKPICISVCGWQPMSA